jgi:hypothetical protein
MLMLPVGVLLQYASQGPVQNTLYDLHRSTGVLLLAFAPLLAGRLPRAGGIAAYATIAASVGVLALGWAVGSTGGKLVYRDGAAAAWTGGALNAQQPVDATHREH